MTAGSSTPESGFVGVWSTSALLVLVLTSVVPPLFSIPWQHAVPLSLVGILFPLVTTVGARAVERRPSGRGLAALFGAQLVLGAVAIAVSGGYAMLIVLGTVSQAVLYLRVRAAALVFLLVLGLLSFGFYLLAPDLVAAARGMASVLAAATFVAAFSWMALRQHEGRRSQARLAEELRDANEQLRVHASEASALAAERERVRIARDMHDSVGHCLTAAHIQLEVAAAFLESDLVRTRSAIEASSRLTHEALGEVRRSVRALRDEARVPLDQGIEMLLGSVRASGVEARLIVEGAPRRLDPGVELALFRVVQESLTNVQRHAHANRVDLRLCFQERTVELSVQDDGVGGGPEDQGGFGLRGMGERVAALGGSLRLERARGFLVEVEVPL